MHAATQHISTTIGTDTSTGITATSITSTTTTTTTSCYWLQRVVWLHSTSLLQQPGNSMEDLST